MNLYLLRHGIAAEPGTAGITRDADRPLTADGEKKVGKIARAMKAMELSFDAIVSSPYVRARQTAELVAESLGSTERLQLSEHLTPEGEVRALLESMNRAHARAENVLLVGHEPYLSDLI